jgi:dipeptidyl aminopeptidase/acylaminoacyl peptidase
VILTETQKTFVMGWEFFHVNQMDWLRTITLLEDGKRFIWVSERDGWKHLYLYNLDGTLIRRLTKGAFPVVRVETVDEKAGWIYFTAHADRQRPYDTHLYRVSLEGREFMQLTEGTGQHDIQFAPSRKFFLDIHSSAARPPAVDLLRADGTLQQTLSKANIDALKARLKWNPPEEFVVKAADGQTELYGVLYKPYDFDPNKKYPVIERIYAGPQLTVVPHTFISNWGGVVDAQALSQLGFIVLVVDGRGTPERGKEFQDVVYRNIGRYEIPDHVAALNQLAEERPYMDLSRVGIYGGSGGGYFTIRAMLLAPDVYHVGIATNADVERYNHTDGEEVYMGLPENNKEGYEYGSNIRLAGNLKGRLLLIQSTGDMHGTFSWSMKLVEAFIRAGKPYDLIALPDQGHIPTGTSGKYWLEAIRRYFQEHLKP